VNPEIGQQFQTETADGQPLLVMVTAVEESGVTLDANHPLAGKDLTFDIELMEIA
jgi:FKBP-type peptidyl-prolyl cis-trans isomerase 2